MEPRKVFFNTEYQIPKTSYTLSGYSRSCYRSGFYINGLGIALDGGPQYFKRVSHYLITHGHSDHTASIPFSLIGDMDDANPDAEKPIIYCPDQVADLLDQYILSMFRSNYGSTKLDSRIRSFYSVEGLDHGAEFDLDIKKQRIRIRAYKADHSVPTLVYGISLIKKKLKPEYTHLSKAEIGKLARSGEEVSAFVEEPLLAYVLDSSIKTLETTPEILDYPTVIIECTFLLEEEKDMAVQKKHIHWQSLMPYIQDRPDTHFILAHFSLRYTDEEIQDFFREQIKLHDLSNIYPWLSDSPFEPEEDQEELDDVLENYEDSVKPRWDMEKIYNIFWGSISLIAIIILHFCLQWALGDTYTFLLNI